MYAIRRYYEMEEYLDEEERSLGNKRNGKGQKTVKTGVGNVTIEPPRITSYNVCYTKLLRAAV